MTKLTTTTEIRDLSPPGSILAEALEERGMSNSELARRTGLSEKHISQLVNAHVLLSLDVAFKLEQTLSIPASLWLNLESNYRVELKRATQRAGLKVHARWMANFPVLEMMRSHYIPDVGRDAGARVEALLTFFGVSSPEAWSEEWSHVTLRFRKSPKFRPDHYALTAWLRRAEVEAQAIRCSPFNKTCFLSVLGEARKLTTADPREFQPRIVELCASSGVAVTFIPSLPKLAINGATRWIGAEKATISLSLRHKSDDQFWFTFFHEACHVLEHKTSTIYIDASGDSDGDPAEQRANEFACDWLIPPKRYKQFVTRGKPGLNTIEAFAKEIGISPGIVVGRLQHEGVIAHNIGNGLKQMFKWDFEA